MNEMIDTQWVGVLRMPHKNLIFVGSSKHSLFFRKWLLSWRLLD